MRQVRWTWVRHGEMRTCLKRMCRLTKGKSQNGSTEEKPNSNSRMSMPRTVSSRQVQKRKTTRKIITARILKTIHCMKEGKVSPMERHRRGRCSALATRGHGIIHRSKGQAVAQRWTFISMINQWLQLKLGMTMMLDRYEVHIYYFSIANLLWVVFNNLVRKNNAYKINYQNSQ